MSMSSVARDANTNIATSGCSSLGISVITNTEEQGKIFNTGEKEKRDYLSPIHDPGIVGVITSSSPCVSYPRDKVDNPHTRHTLPFSSPSQTHPYVSGIHISPPCTSGALTHRLLCGHLVLTTRPEVCANNCAVAKTTFATAKLKAQGFVACARNLDEAWKCPSCAKQETRQEQEGRKCLGVLGMEMGRSVNDGMEPQSSK
jgi:hypothetical protein